MKRNVLIPLTVLPVLLALLSINLAAQSLADYQMEAAGNNPALRAAYNEYQGALLKAPQLRTLPDPEIAFAYFISPIETRLGPQQARLSLTQMIPWFGSLADREKESLLQARARFEQFQEQRNQLFHQMEQLWAELYRIEEQIRLTEENLDVVNTLVNTTLRRYETGLVPQVDVLRAQIEQEDLKTTLQLLDDNKQVLINRFNELRNVDAATEITIPDSLSVAESMPLNESEWLNKVNARNPNLNYLRYKADAAETAVEVARNNGKPTLALGLDYIATGERTDVPTLTDNGKDAWIARLSVKIPLFRGKYRAQTTEASLMHDAAQDRIMAGENQLETTFYSALRDLKDAQRRFRLYDEQQIQRVQQAVNIMLQSYASDNSQFEEILRLQRKLFSYELERIKARAEEFKAFSFLRYLSGSQNITPEDINY